MGLVNSKFYPKSLIEALRIAMCDDKETQRLVNAQDEQIQDLKGVTAQMDSDSGIAGTTFAASHTDDDPTDGQ